MKIINSFKVKLTQRQAEKIRAQWRRHGRYGGAFLIAQPVTSWGPFQIKNAFLNCALVDPEIFKAISAILARAEKEPCKKAPTKEIFP